MLKILEHDASLANKTANIMETYSQSVILKHVDYWKELIS